MTTTKPAAAKATNPAVRKPAAAKTTAATPAVKKPAVRKPAATKAAAAKPAAAKPASAPAEVTPATEAPKKRYRMLTGIDDSAFCQKVSDALNDGYELYGSPTMTFDGKNVYVGQAVILKKLPKKGKRK